MNEQTMYCLDTNVFIEAWNKYYSRDFCPDYWDILIELGKRKLIFIPKEVFNEIDSSKDELTKWLKESSIPVHSTDDIVTGNVTRIFEANPLHINLVQESKGKSLADPWVIAHAMKNKATVVTKESKIYSSNSNKIHIPDVCENMRVKWIDDYQMVKELGIKFSCECPLSKSPIITNNLF
jgi:predicted nucleic acid-binding protein